MAPAFRHDLVELSGINGARLVDVAALSSLVVAAAGAMGLAADAPPVARTSHLGVAVGLVARDGHIVLHTVPDAGACVVDVMARGEMPIERAIEAIARRLEPSARQRADS
jgi:S-adenosylmethionine/arginine decarboxylase-like enzyme